MEVGNIIYSLKEVTASDRDYIVHSNYGLYVILEKEVDARGSRYRITPLNDHLIRNWLKSVSEIKIKLRAKKIPTYLVPEEVLKTCSVLEHTLSTYLCFFSPSFYSDTIIRIHNYYTKVGDYFLSTNIKAGKFNTVHYYNNKKEIANVSCNLPYATSSNIHNEVVVLNKYLRQALLDKEEEKDEYCPVDLQEEVLGRNHQETNEEGTINNMKNEPRKFKIDRDSIKIIRGKQGRGCPIYS